MEKGARHSSSGSAACDEALAIVAHELRSPLSAIAGWAGLLRKSRLSAEQSRRAIEIICRNVDAQARLIEDLLHHSQIARGELCLERDVVELGELAASAVEAVRPIGSERGIGIDLKGSEGLAVHGDAGRLRQVLYNLLGNAIRYSPDRSRVELRTARDGHEAIIEVRDTGVGIPPSLLPHLFERFRRGEKSKPGGLGLGLAISREIVALHGGTIVAESAGEGRGATFTVRLPALDAALHDARPSVVRSSVA